MARRKAASVGELNELHAYIAKFFTYKIKDSLPPELGGNPIEYEIDEETGEKVKVFKMPMSDSTVGHIISFLKHNEVSAEPEDEALSELKEEFKDDFEERRAAAAALIENSTESQREQMAWIK